MKTSGPFYLSVIDKPMTRVWFNGEKYDPHNHEKTERNSPLKDVCTDKTLPNHSARKTVVKKLKGSAVPKCEIKNSAGHTSEKGLDDYDSSDENEQQMISKAGVTR